MGRYYDSYWPPYVSVAQRKQEAKRLVSKMKKKGKKISPIEINGRKITTTFWGDAWCHNLEVYSDFSNRLPRGRSYVRNGSVIDLQIKSGVIEALVSGSDLYTVKIKIKPLQKKKWTDIKQRCAGQIGSLVELLQGEISSSVMEIVTEKGDGLFPSPKEITLDCSCPDRATMCKHVAATLYGVGARLDAFPELLFTLRGIDPAELLTAAIDQPSPVQDARVLDAEDLSIFGIDIDLDNIADDEPTASASETSPKRHRKTSKNIAKKATAPRTPVKKKTTRKSASKKSAAKKTGARKTSSKTKTTKKSASKTVSVKKTTTKKASAKKKAAKKPVEKKAPAKKKTAKKKPIARKTPAKKKVTKKSARR